MNELKAPAHWRCIDFISDLHLHEGLPRTFEAFAAYLAQTPADAVLILGDLFEAWVGDDMRHQPFEARCTQALHAAGSRLWLGFMVGNRDFLLGTDMAHACQAHPLEDPCVLEAFGQRHLLTHGDAWCLNDTAYLAFRQHIRQPDWCTHFLARPLDERLAIAQKMRSDSQSEQRGMAYLADVDASHAQDWLTRLSCQSLVHGHTHRPGSAPFTAQGAWRHVLSDWHLDTTPDNLSPARGEILRLSANGFERLTWPTP